jgi:hypothetical protein
LHFVDHGISFAEYIDGTALGDGNRFDPESNAGLSEQLPSKFFAGVDLPRGSDIGMSQHLIGGHVMPGENAATECRHCRNLPPGKIGIAVLVPRIGITLRASR